MPITYQRLGNSGGGMVDLKITTYPNMEVKLQGDKVARTLISDDQGVAIFKRLKGGTYTATAKGKTKEIAVVSEQEEALLTQIKDLPLKSKIKFSSGKKFILMIKDPATLEGDEHKPNIACLFSEFVIEKHVLKQNTIEPVEDAQWTEKMESYYNELTWKEKETLRVFHCKYSYAFYLGGMYFYLPHEAELGVGTGSETVNKKYNWGFANDASRIRKLEDGSAQIYFTRGTGGTASVGINIRAVNKNGAGYFDYLKSDMLPFTTGIVPCCDISQDAYVALDSDGYYRILGM